MDLFSALARYDNGDPRCSEAHIQPGEPWLLDPDTGVQERDLIRLVEVRAKTNLRIRQSNDAVMRRWLNNDSDEPPPTPEPEECSARTIEAFGRTIGAMFRDAHAHGLLSYQPWSARVAEEVPCAARVSYTQRTVASPELITAIATTIGAVVLIAEDKDGLRAPRDGRRYSAMVEIAGMLGLRPEESIAVRDDWVFADPDDPRIVLHWAEVYEPSNDGRRRISVPLKHRRPGEVRVVRPHPDESERFIRIVTEHRASWVVRDETADEDGGYFFTNHAHRPIELSNFGRWWAQALSEVPASNRTALLEDLPFRRLRAAAITHWLVAHGLTTSQAADKAGNSQAVIEKHYKGVLEARAPGSSASSAQHESQRTTSRFLTGPLHHALLSAESVAALTDAELGQLTGLVRAELAARPL